MVVSALRPPLQGRPLRAGREGRRAAAGGAGDEGSGAGREVNITPLLCSAERGKPEGAALARAGDGWRHNGKGLLRR